MKQFFIDTETTGTNPKDCAVVQIAGIIVVDGEEKERVNFFGAPIKGQYVSEQALEVQGKTRADIEAYPPATQMYSQLISVMSGYVNKFDRLDKFHLIGWNADFDYQMLWNWFDKMGDKYFGSWFFNPPLDVAKIAGYILQPVRPTLSNFKLGTVAEYLGIETGNLHDALADIELTKKIADLILPEQQQQVLFDLAMTNRKTL